MIDYQQMRQKFLNGQITQQQWVDFCQQYFLDQVMTDPQIVDVFVRLKNR